MSSVGIVIGLDERQDWLKLQLRYSSKSPLFAHPQDCLRRTRCVNQVAAMM